MRILKIRLAPRGRDRVLLHLDGAEPLEIALEVMERSNLHVGGDVTPRALERLREDDTKWRVRQAALHLLSYRPRAEQELRTRLRSKDFPPALVEWCIHGLVEQGLLDDHAFASAFVRTRLRLKPRGRFRLSQELRQKGVAVDVADRAIEDAFRSERATEEELATEVARSWVDRQGHAVVNALASNGRSKERERAQRRLHAFLSRRGFRPDALHDGLARAVEYAREG